MQPFSGSVRQCQEVCITTLILKVIRDCKYLIIVRREIASRPEQIKENMAGGMKVVTEGLEVIKENMEKVDALVKEGDEAIKRLQELSFNAPVIIRDEIKFRKMLLGLPTLIIYCDPMIHGRDVYNKILASVSEAR